MATARPAGQWRRRSSRRSPDRSGTRGGEGSRGARNSSDREGIDRSIGQPEESRWKLKLRFGLAFERGGDRKGDEDEGSSEKFVGFGY